MKYDSKLTELKNLLPVAKSILIVVPAGANIDALSASLTLFLTLEASGKQVSIVSDDEVTVGQSMLFGVDHIQKNIPQTGGGNLTVTLEGVAASDNTIPTLEKLDWYAENSNLNLVFHVLPGQTFQPAKIVPRFQGSGFNLIFVVGAVNLNALGNVYSANQHIFSGTHIVNIDTQSANTSFAATNVLDTNASSVSEVMSSLITDLGFVLNADTASNLLAGIFDATSNLTNEKVNAETYMAVANCLRVGGKKPSYAKASEGKPSQPAYDWNALMPKDSASTNKQPVPQVQPNSVSSQAPLNTEYQAPLMTDYTVPPIAKVQPVIDQGDDFQPSPEERPAGEGVISETVEPEWLTPKIFKGSSLG